MRERQDGRQRTVVLWISVVFFGILALAFILAALEKLLIPSRADGSNNSVDIVLLILGLLFGWLAAANVRKLRRDREPLSVTTGAVPEGVETLVPEKPAAQQPSRLRWVGGMAVVAVLVLAGSALAASGGGSGNEAGAQVACETFIKERLKSPSSAKFNHLRAVQLDETYKVTTQVDADNSFGASIRSTWTCRVIRDDSKRSWTLDLLDEH